VGAATADARETARTLAEIPGPAADPRWGPRGNMARFLRDPVGVLVRIHREHGEMASLSRAAPGPVERHVRRPETLVMAFSPALNQAILSQPDVFHSNGLTAPGPAGSAHRRIGRGLFSLNGQDARHQRRVIMPALQRRSAHAAHDTASRHALEVAACWRDGAMVNLRDQMRLLSLKVSNAALFGIEVGDEKPEMARLIERWMILSSSVAVRLSPEHRPSAAMTRMLAIAVRLESLAQEMISRRRSSGPPAMAARAGNGHAAGAETPGVCPFSGHAAHSMRPLDDATAARPDALACLLDARDEFGEPLTAAEIAGHATILLAAAYETTADAMMWTLFLLAQHPKVMQEVVNDLIRVTGPDADAPVTIEQVTALETLERAIRESLRLLGPAVYSHRTAITDTHLGGYEIPKGTCVTYSPYVTHRLPEIFAEPLRFDPSRWLRIKPGPYEYLPFGSGPRLCVGAGMAMQTMMTSLATILKRWRPAAVPGARIDRFIRVTLNCRGGLPMVLRDARREPALVPGAVPVRGNIHEMVRLEGAD